MRAGPQVRLFFSSFGLEQGKDFVSVYDGESSSRPLLARLTGDTLPMPITSSNGTLLVSMVTDEAASSDVGFAASYFDVCTAGYVPGAGGGPGINEHCEPCAAGSYAAIAGLGACSRCDTHQYQPVTGAAGCIDCPAATQATFRGATSVADCDFF